MTVKIFLLHRFLEEINDKVEVVEELFNTPYGSWKLTIKDLDGNELGFGQA